MSKLFPLLSILLITSCMGIDTTTKVTLSGSITDSYGNAQVITLDDDIDVCVKGNAVVDFETTSFKSCESIVSNQTGDYTVTLRPVVKRAKEKAQIQEILNYKIYLRQQSETSTAEYWLISAVIKDFSVDKTSNEISVEADFAVID